MALVLGLFVVVLERTAEFRAACAAIKVLRRVVIDDFKLLQNKKFNFCPQKVIFKKTKLTLNL